MKTQNGITLIALIITIRVMIILVGVSVSVALNTGLFKSAQGAAKNTEAERVNETKISEGKIQKEDGTWVDIEEYADSFKSAKLDLSGKKAGDTVEYSAGGVDEWRILYIDEVGEGSATIVGEFKIDGGNSHEEYCELYNNITESAINSRFVNSITDVKMVYLSDLIDIDSYDCTWSYVKLSDKDAATLESALGYRDSYHLAACEPTLSVTLIDCYDIRRTATGLEVSLFAGGDCELPATRFLCAVTMDID